MKKTLLMLALAAGFASFAQNAQAALITINIGPTGFNIGGINGGVSNNNYREVANFPISGNAMYIFNNYAGLFTGLRGEYPLVYPLVLAAGDTPATPVNFAPNARIGDGSTYYPGFNSVFKFQTTVSPDFGPGSYMGFRTAQDNYGWLEVTWTASSDQFQILSGAYENTPNVAILAGAGGAAPIPEPGTWAAMAIFAGGAAFAGWRRRNSAKIAA